MPTSWPQSLSPVTSGGQGQTIDIMGCLWPWAAEAKPGSTAHMMAEKRGH